VGSHPANLGLRFLLELIALFSLGLWGWRTAEGPLRWVLVLGLPLVVLFHYAVSYDRVGWLLRQ